MPKGGQQPADGWQDRFFEALRKTNLISSACQAAGISRTFVYAVRRRDESFAERWADEEERNTEILEQIAVKRAAESSDTLLIFLLKARKPMTYRENIRHEHEHQHTVGGEVSVLLEGKQPVEFAAAKRREAAALLLAADENVINGTAEEIHESRVEDQLCWACKGEKMDANGVPCPICNEEADNAAAA